MDYISLIKIENEDWKIGFGRTNNKKEHDDFKKELIKCNDVEDVKIFEITEVE